METINRVLRTRGKWPATEILLNFSADLIRRAGGQLKKGQFDLGGVAQADKVCGGDWWRDVALRAHEASGGENWEAAADAVASEYAKRLSADTSYGSVVAPVRRKSHHQPVYYLIFLTQSAYGFWVFGVAAAKAREKWLEFLGSDSSDTEGVLPMDWGDPVADQIKREHSEAIEYICDNLRRLTADGQPKAVVQHFETIYGSRYGEAKETAFTAALRELVKSGEIEFVTKGNHPHKHVIRKATI